jgi:hypothetical protein
MANFVGSVLLLPELLGKPTREGRLSDVRGLSALLERLDLRPLDHHTAEVSVTAAAVYKLKAGDAVHLATAIVAGADRFITNNQKHFPQSIGEIEVVYPEDLPAAGATR